MSDKIPISVFIIALLLVGTYAILAAEAPGIDQERPEAPPATPGVVKSAVKQFFVSKYTGEEKTSPETATKTNLDFPAPEQAKTEEKTEILPKAKEEITKGINASPSVAPPKVCNDCDVQTGTGISFGISGGVNVLNMAVCNGNATEKECREAPSCGVDKSCICEAFLKNSCEVRCFNVKGKYYVTVDGFRGLFDSVDEKDGNYDYECPGVSTESLLKTKQSLLEIQARVGGISAKVDLIKANADNDTTAAFQKYSNVLKKISEMIDDQLKLIDAVLASPTDEGIQQSQTKTDDLKKSIAEMLKTLQ